MEVFDIVFNKQKIYETLFFNIKSVSTYGDVRDLKENEPEVFKQWETICKTKYNVNRMGLPGDDAYLMLLNDSYVEKAMYYPEFSKIVAITYATVYVEDGQLKRHFKKIVNPDEFEIIKVFNDVLTQISSDGVQSNPQYFPTLCGHNIINNDIPLYLKRLIAFRNEFESKENLIPLILKNAAFFLNR